MAETVLRAGAGGGFVSILLFSVLPFLCRMHTLLEGNFAWGYLYLRSLNSHHGNYCKVKRGTPTTQRLGPLSLSVGRWGTGEEGGCSLHQRVVGKDRSPRLS